MSLNEIHINNYGEAETIMLRFGVIFFALRNIVELNVDVFWGYNLSLQGLRSVLSALKRLTVLED